MNSPQCKMGLFVASQSTGVTVLPVIAYFTDKVIGAVAFIRLLLLIAGVEPNPGPTDKLLFRYEYLLMKVGTEVLRKVFDNIVGHDFMRYLNANPTQYKQLGYLINRIFNDTQKNSLPPVEMKPNASKFDITLLALLLRNVCGLCNQGDPVWKTPAPGDLSVEADITRIRVSRNNLLHSGTVYISEADYTDKWDTLCKILKRLGSKYGMTNLSTLIDEAENKKIDEELKKRYDSTLQAWHESERLFDCGIEGLHHGQSKLEDGQSTLKVGQSKLEIGQSKLEDGQTEMKQVLSKLNAMVQLLKRSIDNVERHVEHIEQTLKKPKHGILEKSETDIKEILKKSYQDNYHTLGVLPLCGEDDSMELETIYQQPEIYYRNRQQEENYPILSFKELFSRKDNSFRNIFVTGDAGVGKTSFCQCIAYLWCKSLNGENVSNEFLQECVDFTARFDFVFYISLRDTVHEDIISMIIDLFFYTTYGEKREEMIQLIENILQQKDCLIILDGLDEWFPHTSRGKTSVLPRKISSDKCTYLTTCRPYKLENVRLSNNDIEHQVQIVIK